MGERTFEFGGLNVALAVFFAASTPRGARREELKAGSFRDPRSETIIVRAALPATAWLLLVFIFDL
jgi:hypothetical protein